MLETGQKQTNIVLVDVFEMPLLTAHLVIFEEIRNHPEKPRTAGKKQRQKRPPPDRQTKQKRKHPATTPTDAKRFLVKNDLVGLHFSQLDATKKKHQEVIVMQILE